MRQDQTLKIVANFFSCYSMNNLKFLVHGEGLCKLQAMETAEKCYIWDCFECSDDPPKLTKLCARFRSVEEQEEFKKVFEKSHSENKEIFKIKSEERKEDEH